MARTFQVMDKVSILRPGNRTELVHNVAHVWVSDGPHLLTDDGHGNLQFTILADEYAVIDRRLGRLAVITIGDRATYSA